ncbi:hypothetical protein SSYM_1004 [Serratia symbiotica str. Tucson]|uniref:Uncharacterized protein n=2 Tax=Serratia symbiotica TaxID=138074 RepID=E9CLA5_9GAMM|nr:hypothetical protein [Serratia symbiotica]EFW12682.1 hypothetical protein SSYM_1004 [Serratia symbiotica str. Tucson]BBI92552.1 uncharacterized protein SSYIS1_23250 [Serratia symbiotica]
MSGSKIDVEAPKKKRQNSPSVHPWHDPDKKVNISPRATLYSKVEDLSGVKNQLFAVSVQDKVQRVSAITTKRDVQPFLKPVPRR